MELHISNKSDKPIYEQISEQIKSAIMQQKLNAGEMLPSMRALAKSLHISVITTQRAYEELQNDGFIETVAGKGTFVSSQNSEFILEERQKQAENHLMAAAEIGRSCGISLETLVEILSLFYEEES